MTKAAKVGKSREELEIEEFLFDNREEAIKINDASILSSNPGDVLKSKRQSSVWVDEDDEEVAIDLNKKDRHKKFKANASAGVIPVGEYSALISDK